MTPYTMEQIVGVMRKVKAGEIRVSDNVLAGWEEEERQQKEGKKKMRTLGTVQLPSEAFMAVLKLDEE